MYNTNTAVSWTGSIPVISDDLWYNARTSNWYVSNFTGVCTIPTPKTEPPKPELEKTKALDDFLDTFRKP